MSGDVKAFDDLVAAADQFERDGAMQCALAAWRNIAVSFPETPDTVANVGRLFKLTGNLPEARAALGAGVERFPDDERLAVDHGWVVHTLADFPAATALFQQIRNRFPASLQGYLGGGLTYSASGAFDEADDVYRAAFSRFPADLYVIKDFAWNARRRGDLPEARQRMQMLLTLFPDVPASYLQMGDLLREIDLFADADRMLADGIEKFPEASELAIAYAWVAHHRQDWPEALKRWDRVVSSFHATEGRVGAARVLMELGRYDDAREILIPALRMAPNDPALAVMSGYLANCRQAVDEADKIWADVRSRFPAEVAGFTGWASALEAAGRADEAEAVLQEAAAAFPADPHIMMSLAMIPQRRQLWGVAIERWNNVRLRFPDVARSHTGLAEVLFENGEVEAAKIVFDTAVGRFQNDFGVALAYADMAAKSRDWPEALERLEGIIARFPENPAGYEHMGRALSDAGQFERAEDHLNGALKKFPNNLDLELQRALTVCARREWPRALDLLAKLKERFPFHPRLQSSIAHALPQARQDMEIASFEAQAGPPPFDIPEILHASNGQSDLAALSCKQLLMGFESIGDTCEFGIVQRHYGAEPLSLLRWVSMAPDTLVTAINDSFVGVGDPENMILEEIRGEYTTQDRRFHMFGHTFIPSTSAPREKVFAQQCKRMQYLRQKLLLDLAGGSKIFVYKSDQGVTDERANALHDAIRKHGTSTALLIVRLQDGEHQAPEVQSIGEGLFIGYIDRFSTVDINFDTWVKLCQEAQAIWQSQQAGRVPSIPAAEMAC